MLRNLNKFYRIVNRIIQNGGNKAVRDPGATFALQSRCAATFSLNPFDANVQEISSSSTSVGGIKHRVFTRSRVRTKWENSFRTFTDPRLILHRLYHDAGQYRFENSTAGMAAVVCERCRPRDHGSPGDCSGGMSFLPRSGRGRLGSLAVPGGPADGKHVPGGLQIDVAAVSKAFDFAPDVYWQSEKFSSNDELGNHLSFQGVARNVQVWLRILQSAPEWAGPGRLVHAESGRVDDIW